ncbi:MAG: hypothetical protein BHV90_14740 [Clostridiales bacterium 42_27]|jgi:hypothetical protein|nr:MAG: hypothetical protein BHV90_14740 [Clostridiales bacterium 42_27]
MSCKSLIYVAMQTPTAVAVNGIIPLGTIVRRYGCNCNLNGNGIAINGQGYYDVDVSVEAVPDAAGTVTVQLLKDGVAVPGATAAATVAAVANTVTLAFPATVRLGCCSTGSVLTLLLTGAASTVNNVAARVEKI